MDTTRELDEVTRLRNELSVAQRTERDLRDTRRAVVNLLEDLDEDRRRLARAEQEWRTAFDGIRDAMFMHDAEMRILRANRAYLSLARCSLNEAIGMPFWKVFPQLPHAPERPCTESADEQEIAYGGRLLRSRAYVVNDHEGRYSFSLHVIEDFTERRRTQEELHRRSEQLAASNRSLTQALADLKSAEVMLVQSERLAAIGTLAAGVAHELNNPLTGVMNYVEYAKTKIADGKARETLQKAERELQRMAGFVRNLLLLGRPAGEFLEPVRIDEALERAVDLLRADLRHWKVELVNDLPGDLPAVWGSAAPLQQVFINLLLNALEATKSTREKRIRIEGGRDDGFVRFTVSDTGVGIPAEFVPRLFEPFATTKAPGQGTGLGLPMSRSIVSSSGGTIDYVPEGRGATFAVRLRVARI